ncbi:MAG: hypothetical protein ABJA35_11240 [Parafilimonas sp.]
MPTEKMNKKTAEEGENIQRKRKEAAKSPTAKNAKDPKEKKTKMNKDVDQE